MKASLINLANRKNNASGEIVAFGQEQRKKELLENIIPPQYAENHIKRTCHIHDLEYYDVTYNCIGISVENLIGNKTRSFRSMLSALHRAIVELTNLQSGGIGIINFDSDIAMYLKDEDDSEIIKSFKDFFINLNICTRKGCEKPYVTFNFGLDTSMKGQRVSTLMLDAYLTGDEDGNPFIFPNLVFKLKSGVNIEPDTPNYALYMKSLSVTAKRMVPTYFNCDSKINRDYASSRIGIMGCRSRVVSNINGREGSLNRGNVASVTLNLVQMAYQAVGNFTLFYSILDANMKAAKELLLHRFETLISNGLFADYYDRGYYLDADVHDARKMLKNGTLSIGFIGLWDAVAVMCGIDSLSIEDINKYYEEAYGIIEHMRTFIDKCTDEEGLNFSLLASAAEGVTGSFAKYDEEHLGREFTACKKGFYTNSFHVPVGLEVNYRKKIDIESNFHKLCNGGSITYVEMKEMPCGNIEAVQEIVEYAYSHDCNYIGINFPMDNCLDCGYVGRVAGRCPKCNSENIRRLRRVSGYLAEENCFTKGKRKELMERKVHYINGMAD